MQTLTIRLQKAPFGLLRVCVLETGQVAYLPCSFLEEASRLVALPQGATVADTGATAVHAARYRDQAGEVVELQVVHRPAPAAAALPDAA